MKFYTYHSFMFLLFIIACNTHQEPTITTGDNPIPETRAISPTEDEPCSESLDAIIEFWTSICTQPTMTEDGYKYSDYPKVPLPNCTVFEGLEHELENEAYVEQFKQLYRGQHGAVAEEVINYFRDENQPYILMSLMLHKNADNRIRATEAFRALNYSTKEAIAYHIYIIENQNDIIAGSEDATIHHIWMQQLAKNLNAMTGETFEVFVDGKGMAYGLPLWKKYL